MRRVVQSLTPEACAPHTRSLRLGGHSTSIRLEGRFWRILEEIAAREGVSLAKFLTVLHDELTERDGEVGNFASLLRCACLAYLCDGRDRAIACRDIFAEGDEREGPTLVAAE